MGCRIGLIADPLTHYRQHSQRQIGVQKRIRWQQFEYRRSIAADNFPREAENYNAAAARVTQLAGSDDLSAMALREKCQDLRARALVRERGLASFFRAFHELFAGRYERGSQGWRAFLMDFAVLIAGPR